MPLSMVLTATSDAAVNMMSASVNPMAASVNPLGTPPPPSVEEKVAGGLNHFVAKNIATTAVGGFRFDRKGTCPCCGYDWVAGAAATPNSRSITSQFERFLGPEGLNLKEPATVAETLEDVGIVDMKDLRILASVEKDELLESCKESGVRLGDRVKLRMLKTSDIDTFLSKNEGNEEKRRMVMSSPGPVERERLPTTPQHHHQHSPRQANSVDDSSGKIRLTSPSPPPTRPLHSFTRMRSHSLSSAGGAEDYYQRYSAPSSMVSSDYSDDDYDDDGSGWDGGVVESDSESTILGATGGGGGGMKLLSNSPVTNHRLGERIDSRATSPGPGAQPKKRFYTWQLARGTDNYVSILERRREMLRESDMAHSEQLRNEWMELIVELDVVVTEGARRVRRPESSGLPSRARSRSMPSGLNEIGRLFSDERPTSPDPSASRMNYLDLAKQSTAKFVAEAKVFGQKISRRTSEKFQAYLLQKKEKRINQERNGKKKKKKTKGRVVIPKWEDAGITEAQLLGCGERVILEDVFENPLGAKFGRISGKLGVRVASVGDGQLCKAGIKRGSVVARIQNAVALNWTCREVEQALSAANGNLSVVFVEKSNFGKILRASKQPVRVVGGGSSWLDKVDFKDIKKKLSVRSPIHRRPSVS